MEGSPVWIEVMGSRKGSKFVVDSMKDTGMEIAQRFLHGTSTFVDPSNL